MLYSYSISVRARRIALADDSDGLQLGAPVLHDSDMIDNVSDLSVTTGTVEELPGYGEWIDDCDRAHEAERELEDAMLAAAEADGVIDFGPFDREAWEETMNRFPEGTGLFPQIAKTGHAEFPWSAELRRPTPSGPDIVPCLTWRTQKEAWTACVSRALAMVALVECGKRELAEGMFIKSAK
jgi:hypothetical protein